MIEIPVTQQLARGAGRPGVRAELPAVLIPRGSLPTAHGAGEGETGSRGSIWAERPAGQEACARPARPGSL